MPIELASSVDVASTARAHRMQRSTSTEATGIEAESMLCRYEMSESEEAEDDEEP